MEGPSQLTRLPSHLPSWVLAMRLKVQQARENMEHCNEQLVSLKENTAKLGYSISETISGSSAAKLPTLPTALPKDKFGLHKLQPAGSRGVLLLILLPPDIFHLLLTVYLKKKDVAALESTAASIKKYIAECFYWEHLLAEVSSSQVGQNEIGNLYMKTPDVPHANTRDIVVKYLLGINRSVEFLVRLKEQRAVPKHKQINPHRYDKSERSVSYSLPLFDASGRIMSKAESFSNDFRSYTLHRLEDIALQSSKFMDVKAKKAFLKHSVISCMCSLISNEAAALQELACQILANLFAANDYLLFLRDLNLASDQDEPQSGHRKQPDWMDIDRQVQLCDVKSCLFSQLTSPASRLNLRSKDMHSPASAAVQGMSNMQASRALINLFCPTLPVFTNSECVKHNFIRLQTQWPNMKEWHLLQFNKTGSIRNQFRCNLAISPDFYLYGRGRDIHGMFELSGKESVTISGLLFIIYKRYVKEAEILNCYDSGADWNRERVVTENQAAVLEEVSTKAHVNFCAYWSEPQGDARMTGIPVGQAGFFGVYETCGIEPNFQLNPTKGGVFRAVPC